MNKNILLIIFYSLLLFLPTSYGESICQFDQHFNSTTNDISPWIFIPGDNVKKVTTTEHPGMATVWPNDKGNDIKGILEKPIKINDFSLPWEYQLCLVQTESARFAHYSSTQANYAIGLNVAVAFSDPNTWPKDRNVLPPDTKTFQLLVVRIGSTGESSSGLPQYSVIPHPQNYFVWGRGDLGYIAMGDWKIPFIWVGDGTSNWGPASDKLFFKFRLASPTAVEVGIKFSDQTGFNSRAIDCSKYGKITGIWEIGPIFSQDRWIPDVFCRSIPQTRGPHPIMLGDQTDAYSQNKWTAIATPDPEPPKPIYEYYVDYCTFFPSVPGPFEELSDDFDNLGYMGKWQIQSEGTMADTYNNPGYLTLTRIGASGGTGFTPIGGYNFDFSIYKPPLEMEICFIPPADNQPWNFGAHFWLVDKGPVFPPKGFWSPGIRYFPDAKKHKFINVLGGGEYNQNGEKIAKPIFDVQFDEELPESILSSKPVYMLIQIIDVNHVRVGFKAKAPDKWILSKIFDASKVLNGGLTQLFQPNWGLVTHEGTPMYQKFLIDYVHYRYGLTRE